MATLAARRSLYNERLIVVHVYACRNLQKHISKGVRAHLQLSANIHHQNPLFANQHVAVVHDWLVSYAGAERVLAEMLSMVPHAEVFSLVDFLPTADRAFLAGHRVHTSFVQRLPMARQHFRKYLPILPRAAESLDLSRFDVVLSSSHAFAKNVRPAPRALHLCYCYTPMRYAWAMTDRYLADAGLTGPIGRVARWQARRLRDWDLAGSPRVTRFAACSRYIAQRIESAYRRDSQVVYPPVDVEGFAPTVAVPRDDYFVTVSRLVSYKRIDLIVKAFAQLPEHRLLVIGTGPEAARIKAFATPNVSLLGYLPTAEVKQKVQAARAFLFAADEDFGIAPVEAQAAGTPVIAYGQGGALETIVGMGDGIEAPTGIFFHHQTADAIAQAVRVFTENANSFTAERCRSNAARFAPEYFRSSYRAFALDHVPN